jgi:hypothetical protein
MRLLLPTLLLSAASATAQPILTATTNLPTAGLSNTLYRASSAPTATTAITGANVTWDYSSLVSNGTGSSTYAACPGGNPDCGSFTNTPNLNGLEVLTGNTLFYAGSSSVFSIVGSRGAGAAGGTPTNTDYINPEDFLRFPMTYGTTFVDASRSTRTEIGFPARRSSSTTVVADGWGLLKLPGNNNFSNVLRVKRTTVFSDTIDAPAPLGPVITSGTATMNLWYSTSYKDFLMLVVQVNSSAGNATTVAWALPNLTGIDDAAGSFTFTTSPNPAQDRIAIRWAAGTEATLYLQDLTGRTVLQTAGRSEAAMDVASLPRGLYLLRATDAKGTVNTQKILLQ